MFVIIPSEMSHTAYALGLGGMQVCALCHICIALDILFLDNFILCKYIFI